MGISYLAARPGHGTDEIIVKKMNIWLNCLLVITLRLIETNYSDNTPIIQATRFIG